MRSSRLLAAISALQCTADLVCSWDLSMVLDCSVYSISVIHETSWFTVHVLSPHSTCISILDVSEVTLQPILLYYISVWLPQRPLLLYCSQENTCFAFWGTEEHNWSKQCMSYIKWKIYWVYDLGFMKAREECTNIKSLSTNLINSRVKGQAKKSRTRLLLVYQLLINWGKKSTC